jgi:citrate synthase
MEPYARHGVGPNVDLYAGLAYRLLGLPDDLSVPIFVAGRMAGWVAQALEQKANNVLIRPRMQYVGAGSRAYQPIGAR